MKRYSSINDYFKIIDGVLISRKSTWKYIIQKEIYLIFYLLQLLGNGDRYYNNLKT